MIVSSTRAPFLHDEIWVLDVRTGARRSLSRNPTADGGPAVSPDGRLVAFLSDRGGRAAVWVSRPDGTGLRRLAAPSLPAGSVGLPRWSPTGRELAFLATGGRKPARVWVVARTGGAVRRFGTNASGLDWSPNGRRLAVGEGDHVSVYDQSGRRLWRLRGWQGSWSSRGELAVTAEKAVLITGANGRVRTRIAGAGTIRWSPDGRLLAVFDDIGVRIVTNAGRLRLRKRGILDSYGTAWAPDSRSLFAYDARDRLVRLSADGRVSVVSPNAYSFSLSRSGALALVEGSRIAVRQGGRTRRFGMPPIGVGCRGRGSITVADWVGPRRLLLVGGLHGQNTGDLWVVDPRRGVTSRFLGGPRWEATPSWSRDGSQVAFEEGGVLTHAGSCTGPYLPSAAVARADGTGRRKLTEAWDIGPRWSPDGTLVAFQRETLDATGFSVAVVDVQSGHERWHTTERSDERSHPSWSAGGTSVVFQSAGTIRRVAADGGVSTVIGRGTLPEASPTDQLVAFVRDGSLRTIGFDGSGERALAVIRPASPGEPPRWSPDGQRIAIADREGIVVLSRDGGPVTRIRHDHAEHVAWSPDGRLIAFEGAIVGDTPVPPGSDLPRRGDLFVVSSSGGTPRRVTHDYAHIDGIAWRP